MEFRHNFFNVDGFLRAKLQPVFFLRDLDLSSAYWTLTDMDTTSFEVTKAPSEAVRVPVHATKVKQLDWVSDGSLIFSAGLELALNAYSQLVKHDNFRGSVCTAHVIICTECHNFENYVRAYCGISLEVKK